MQSPNLKGPKFLSKCYCCLSSIQTHSSSFDHHNSTNMTNSSTFHYDFATATISSLYPHTQFTDPESLPSLQQSFRSFTGSFPQYINTVEADQIRADEYPHLSSSSHVCLDYSGHALFSPHQVRKQQEGRPLVNGEFASPSSSYPFSSKKMSNFEISHKTKVLVPSCTSVSESESESESEFESKLKERIMKYLNVSKDDYDMFFTANQTSAFRILAENYPFQTNKNLITVYDHENEAVEAMIECSKSRGARAFSAEFKWPKLKIHSKKLEEMVLRSGSKKRVNRGLFVFPVQSRVSGAKYSYQWMSMARENGWHVLLDATSLGPKDMDTLGLSMLEPDFLICTFYKVFGDDPSGFACLLIKKSIRLLLNLAKMSSTQGIVSLIHLGYVGRDIHNQNSGHLREICHKLSNENNIECVGLDHADFLGLVLIGTRTRCLVNWLTNALLALNHSHAAEGVQLVQVYGPRVKFDRGPAFAFNVFDWKGEKIDPLLVQKLADRNNISLGNGYLKHVWFTEMYEFEKSKFLEKRIDEKLTGECKGKRKQTLESGIEVVTASVDFLTNFEDVYRVWVFVAKFLDADFVEKERWRYTAINRKTVEI